MWIPFLARRFNSASWTKGAYSAIIISSAKAISDSAVLSINTMPRARRPGDLRIFVRLHPQ